MGKDDWVESIEALPAGSIPEGTLVEAIGRAVDQTDDAPTPEQLRALFQLFERYPGWGNVASLITPAELIYRAETSTWLKAALRSFESVPSLGVLYVLKAGLQDQDLSEVEPDVAAIARAIHEGFRRTELREVKKGITRALRELTDLGVWRGEIPISPPPPFPKDFDFVALLGRSVATLDSLQRIFDEVPDLSVPMLAYREAGVRLHFDESMQALRSVSFDVSGRVRDALPFGLRPGSRAELREQIGPPQRIEDDIEGPSDVYLRSECELSLQYDPAETALTEVRIRKA